MNMTNYTVAVWCITYNQKDFIKDALNGFVMQKTNFPFVVIVHDDKSTDGTSDIILEYAKKYPKIMAQILSALFLCKISQNLGQTKNFTKNMG